MARLAWNADARALAAVALAVLVAVLPTWRPDWYQDDQLPTLFRTFHTDLAHHFGILYPRVAPELGFGYGRLLHQFYPPLGVEVAAWLHALGLGYVDAARTIYSLCLATSAVGMYTYSRVVLRGPLAATLAAVAYVWAPYVLLDAHKGGVLGESVALAIMPWSLLAVHRLVCGAGAAWVIPSALGLALIVLGHNITALFWVGLVGLYALLLAARRAHAEDAGPVVAVRSLLAAGAAIVLGLGLATLYWLPAIAELPYSRIADQRKDEFSVGRYLVGPADLLQSSVVFDYFGESVPRHGLTAGMLALVSGALCAATLAARPGNGSHVRTSPQREGAPGSWDVCDAAPSHATRRAAAHRSRPPIPDRLVVAACGLCVLGVLLMQLKPSLRLWETVPLISFVQFPQRLFVFASFAEAVLLGTVPWAVTTLLGRRELGVGAAVAALGALGATSLPGLYWTPPVTTSHLISEDQVGIATVAERRLSERSAFDDYFPSWVQEDAGQITRPPSTARAELYRQAGDGPAPHLRVVERGYLHTVVEAEAEAPSALVLHAFYFPGWTATADGQPLPTGPAGPLGLVRTEVPAGRHTVVVQFGDTPVRQAATVVSAVALLTVLALCWRLLGPLRTAQGVAAVALAVTLPWLLHRATPPLDRPPVQPVVAEVSPTARVVGVELPRRAVRPGETVPVTLLWQATAYTSADLQSGLRLERADGTPVAERWTRPNRERTPTGKWIVGEIVPDTIALRLPPAVPSGRYLLVAGLRDGEARDRATPLLAPVGEIEVR